jgi:transposase
MILMTMDAKKFELLARLLRSRGPVRAAAKLVLVDGKRNADAARETGVSTQSVSNTVQRFRSEDEAIRQVYLG